MELDCVQAVEGDVVIVLDGGTSALRMVEEDLSFSLPIVTAPASAKAPVISPPPPVLLTLRLRQALRGACLCRACTV